MKIFKMSQKKGYLRARVDSYDDLVVLSYVIESGDKLVSYSRRKIKVDDSYDIRLIKVGITVEELKLTDDALSVGGKIYLSSDEQVPLHKYHSIDLAPKRSFVLLKTKMLNFQASSLNRLRHKSPRILICTYEDGYAIFYKITNYSLQKMYELKENVSGKRFRNDSRDRFFRKLTIDITNEYKKEDWDLFIVAGNALGNQALGAQFKGLKIIFDTVSYADTGLKELIRKDTINKLLKGTKIAAQKALMEEYVNGISEANNSYVYGKNEIREALSKGTPEQALVSRDFVMKNKDIIEKLDADMTDIKIFYDKDESLDTLENFGGVLLKVRK
jgi:stalled ribosome rescue protein Dom34